MQYCLSDSFYGNESRSDLYPSSLNPTLKFELFGNMLGVRELCFSFALPLPFGKDG